MENDLLTPKQVAQMLNISLSKLAKLRCKSCINSRNIKDYMPYYKFGNNIRYKRCDIEAYIARSVIKAIQ